MKRRIRRTVWIGVTTLLGSLFEATLLAQSGSEPSDVSAPVAQPATPFSVVARSAHTKTWERVEYETRLDGTEIPRIRSYEEIASGLCVLNPQTGQWEDADESFAVTPEGYAVARRTQHQLIVSPVLNDAEGNVDIQTPDGKRLRSTILALNLHNRITGEDLLLAEVSSNAVGQLVAPNEIVFRNAFEDFADIRILNKKGEVHQDLLINAGLDAKALATSGFPADASSLELWTEYLEAPEPMVASRAVPSTPDAVTEHLDFGVMKMPGGKVYLRAGVSQAGEINVSTRWLTINNRQFIVESIPLGKAEVLLAQMPLKKFIRLQAGARRNLRREPPAPTLVRRKTETILMAKADNREATSTSAQVVWDPVTVNGTLTDMVFKGDTTYRVSGTAYLYGTTKIEGGTVVKFFTNSGWGLYLYGSLKCQASAYRPAIFTSTNDNSVGAAIGTGNPTRTKCDYFANESASMAFTNVMFRYANRVAVGGALLTFFDCQFVDCALAFDNESGQTNILRNALVSKCDSVSDLSFAGEHVTFDQCGSLIKDSGVFSPMYLGNAYLTNCILTAVTNITNSTLQSCVRYTNSTGVFQIAGGGFYYLSGDSTNRNAGTTNISVSLLADLKKKTTYPPVVSSNMMISVPTTRSPQAQRDTDIPDLGYHYEPIDWIHGDLFLTNTALTITEGTVIASVNSTTSAGTWLFDDSSINSVGTALAPIWFVRCSSVQEQAISFGSGYGVLPYRYGSVKPSGTYRFCKFACPADTGFHLYHASTWAYENLLIQDCEFFNGESNFSGYSNTVATLKNNLFHRSKFNGNTSENNGSSLALSNNLFVAAPGNFTINQPSGSTWYAFNNVFDTCNFPTNGTAATCTNGYNAYINCTNRIRPNFGTDIILSNVFTWQSGPLGDFYQPTNSVFINAGNVTADVQGLYHFTTQTNQVRETNSFVDLGYHYVALDAIGSPVDTDGDGVPDYLEDANGNGSVDSGETDWQSATDMGLKVWITRPRNSSILP